MRSADVENKLVAWFEMMMKKYTTLSFKYEYSEKRRVYLVSAIVDLDVESYEQYCSDSMAFEDKLAYTYGDDAPLFTDNEQLFQLSANAKEVTLYVESQEVEMPYTKVQYTISPSLTSVFGNMFHVPSKPSQVYSRTQYWDVKPQQNTYLLAA